MTRTSSVSYLFSTVVAEFACQKTVLFFTFTISLTIRLACYTGLIGSDDLIYSSYAQKISFGTYELEPNHMAVRYGVLLPVAGVYKFFGSYEWTTIAVPLVLSSLLGFTSSTALHQLGLHAVFLLTAIIIAKWAETRTKQRIAFSTVAMVLTVGIICASMTHKTGYSIKDVVALKTIVIEARARGQQICEINGKRAKRWRRALELVGSDVMGCGGEDSVMLTADDVGVKTREKREHERG